MIIGFVVNPRSTQAHFNARTPTWLNQKGYTTMVKSITKDNDCFCCISHSGTFQCLDSHLAEPERIYNKLCLNLSVKMIIVFVVNPRSTQAHFNAGTPTWLNQKGYTTMVKSITKDNDCFCCISQEHSGTFQCQDSYLVEPERICNKLCLNPSVKMIIVFVVYPRSTQASFNARSPTWLNQKGYTTLWLNIIIIFAVYPRGTQAHLNARTPTWLNQKGYVSEKINK